MTSSKVRRLRLLARWRPRLGWVVLFAPATAVVAFDVARRAPRLLDLAWNDRLTYAATGLQSLLLWSSLLLAASRRHGRWRWLAGTLFVSAYTLSLGGQAYFFEQYNLYLTSDVAFFAIEFSTSVTGQLAADLGNFLRLSLLPLATSLVLLCAGRATLRPRRRSARLHAVLGPSVLGASLLLPTQHGRFQSTQPDLLYLRAAGKVLSEKLSSTTQAGSIAPRRRSSLAVPSLSPRPPRQRNVLLLIMESVRADAVCDTATPNCQKTPYSSRLVQERFQLKQLRSLSAATSISLAVLWTGLGPHEPCDVLHSWPLIFDYARAAGYDTAFWTSQNLMFGNSRLWVQDLPVNKFCSATQLDPTAHIDLGAPEHLLAARVSAELAELYEPFLAVVQFSNVHFPYLTDPRRPRPFQPASRSKAPEDNREFFNHYLNAVHQQDQHVSTILQALQASERGQRTAVLYTSDHGEAFREHGTTGHTLTVFDEELRVPGWLYAPAESLTEAEQQHLASKRLAFTFHADFAPTILDLMGVLDDPAISRFRTKMVGTSLLRKETTRTALPLTNCSGPWRCGVENWGYIREPMKLAARTGDRDWSCYDLLRDPQERHDLGPQACGNLSELALKTFGRLPGQR